MEITTEYIRLVNLLHRLELKSHTSAVRIDSDPVSGGETATGHRPPGGADRRDDRQPEYWLRSADHYRRRLAKAKSAAAVLMITADVERTLKAWEKAPIPSAPIPGSPFFRRYVVESDKSVSELARLTGVSRQYLHRLRAK